MWIFGNKEKYETNNKEPQKDDEEKERTKERNEFLERKSASMSSLRTPHSAYLGNNYPFPRPIVHNRAPTEEDRCEMFTIWIHSADGDKRDYNGSPVFVDEVYLLCRFYEGKAKWIRISHDN